MRQMFVTDNAAFAVDESADVVQFFFHLVTSCPWALSRLTEEDFEGIALNEASLQCSRIND